MLETYAREYLAVVGHCQSTEQGFFIQKGRKMALHRDFVIALLNKNQYAEAADKLQAWKALGWIEAEPGHLTKKVHDRTNGSKRRMLVINLAPYEALKKLV